MFPILILTLAAVPQPPVIEVGKDPRQVVVSFPVGNVQPAAQVGTLEFDKATPHLKLVVVDGDGTDGPPVFGRYSLMKSRLVFQPRYLLLPGVKYAAIGRTANGRPVRTSFVIPKPAACEPPRVTGLFPSGRILPANCLKFYIHFSRPMREGRAIFDQIQILGPDRKPVADPWRRTELWNEDATRLTMWIHPGRIKQGVNLREEFGPVLKANQEYRLVISTGVRDASGNQLAGPFEKRFRTAAEDRSRPTPRKWKLSSPEIGTREALEIVFDEPLDRALLNRMLTVKRNGNRIAGRIDVSVGELRWRFTPNENWSSGEHSLHVDGRLEDLAGNTPLRVFDTDLADPPAEKTRLTLPISLREPNSPLKQQQQNACRPDQMHLFPMQCQSTCATLLSGLND